jgi:hypothetical protein
LFLVKIVLSIVVIVSSPNALLVGREKMLAVIVALTATVVGVDAVAASAMIVMKDANAGKFVSSRNRMYWEISLFRDSISLLLHSVASKYEEQAEY